MNYVIHTRNQIRYLECLAENQPISCERDALDWLALCGENEVDQMLIHENNLTDDFFNLRTGVAGDILQRFAIYHVRLAAVINPSKANAGRFGEMVLEANRGSQFRVFQDQESAEDWLFSPKK